MLSDQVHVRARACAGRAGTLSSDMSGAARRMPPATYSVVLIARSFQS
jgi:hypothetical protein